MIKSKTIYNTQTIIVSLSLLLGLFLPHNNLLGQLISGLLPIALFLYFLKEKKTQHSNIGFLFLFVIIVSFSLNSITGEVGDWKSVFRLFNWIFLFFLFPFVSYCKIPLPILYLAVIYVFLSQIAYVFGTSPLVLFFDRIYPYEGPVKGFSSDFLLSGSGDMDFVQNRRYGGLYHNPNQAVRYVSIILAVFLIEAKKVTFIKQLPFLIIVLISVLLSGSRTGLVVIFVLWIASQLLFNSSKGKLKSYMVIGSFIGLLGYAISQLGLSERRVFDISAGVEGSLGTKFVWFMTFFENLDSPIKFLFGHFTTDNIEQYGNIMLDSEWGEIFYNFGVFGVLSLMFFYNKIIVTKDKNLLFLLIILLWGITSTILFSYRMSFIFMLLLSNYYSYYLQNRKLKNI